MTTARATLPLTGPDGTFEKGAIITGVPDETVAVWVEHGAAEYLDQPLTAAPEETATAPAPEVPTLPTETGDAPPPETATSPAPRAARTPKAKG